MNEKDVWEILGQFLDSEIEEAYLAVERYNESETKEREVDVHDELDGSVYAGMLMYLEAWSRNIDVSIGNTGTRFEFKIEEPHIHFELMTSDIFAWGYSNSDPISQEELLEVYREARRTDSFSAIVRWRCLKHEKQQPQGPVIKILKESGTWDDQMEALPANEVDERLKEEGLKDADD